ncbi:unknown [Feldmannia species virus]|uniref:LamG-like jellyroll fold domain-containing protein n=1 Tax=Feldmannia species virus TaxID=39420 RepID=B5LWL3_9PHYC|nr:hypothetical protein FeldSpV_gp124 [Feldmannia species virus]ACH46876.1 unknown [Feldmannia species virus]
MSLGYFARYRFNDPLDLAKEDLGVGDLVVETGSLQSVEDPRHGTVLYLDGATSLASLGDFGDIVDDSSRCFSFWANCDSEFASPVVSYGELESSRAFVVYAKNDLSQPEFYDYQTRVSPSGSDTEQSGWHHFAFTYSADDKVIQIYLDGSLVLQETGVTLTTGASDPLRIGTDGLGEYFEGSLVDIRVFSKNVASSTVLTLYREGPNYLDELGEASFVSSHNRSDAAAGDLVCRTMFGVSPDGQTISQAYFDSSVGEVARVEDGLDDSGTAYRAVSVRDGDGTLSKVLQFTGNNTTFFNNNKESVIFSSEGVHLAEDGERGCMYFGNARQFRLRSTGSSFLVEALATQEYVVKMEVSSV